MVGDGPFGDIGMRSSLMVQLFWWSTGRSLLKMNLH
jgi:hypothetical protein